MWYITVDSGILSAHNHRLVLCCCAPLSEDRGLTGRYYNNTVPDGNPICARMLIFLSRLPMHAGRTGATVLIRRSPKAFRRRLGQTIVTGQVVQKRSSSGPAPLPTDAGGRAWSHFRQTGVCIATINAVTFSRRSSLWICLLYGYTVPGPSPEPTTAFFFFWLLTIRMTMMITPMIPSRKTTPIMRKTTPRVLKTAPGPILSRRFVS